MPLKERGKQRKNVEPEYKDREKWGEKWRNKGKDKNRLRRKEKTF